MITGFRTNVHILPILCMLVALLTACRSHRTAVPADTPYTVVADSVEVDSLFASLTSGYADWTDLYVPVTFVVEAPSAMSISGRATIVRDSAVYMSLRMLGMEVAQLYIDSDSIYAVDKYHKMYIAEDMHSLLSGYDLNIGNIQDLLLGRAFIPGGGTLSRADTSAFLLLRNSAMWNLVPDSDLNGVRWYYTATATDPAVLAALTVGIPDGTSAVCTYANPADTQAGIVASLVSIAVDHAGSALEAQVQWAMADAKWNTGRAITFKAPSPDKYRRIDAMSLLNSLSAEK